MNSRPGMCGMDPDPERPDAAETQAPGAGRRPMDRIPFYQPKSRWLTQMNSSATGHHAQCRRCRSKAHTTPWGCTCAAPAASQTFATGSRTRIGARGTGHAKLQIGIASGGTRLGLGRTRHAGQRYETLRRPRTHAKHTDRGAGGGTRLGMGRTREDHPGGRDSTDQGPDSHQLLDAA